MTQKLYAELSRDGTRTKIELGHSLTFTLEGENGGLNKDQGDELSGLLAPLNNSGHRKTRLALFLAETRHYCPELEEWRLKLVSKLNRTSRQKAFKEATEGYWDIDFSSLDRASLLSAAAEYLLDEGKLDASPANIFYSGFYADRPNSLLSADQLISDVERDLDLLHLMSRRTFEPGRHTADNPDAQGWRRLKSIGLASATPSGHFVRKMDQNQYKGLQAWRWLYEQADLLTRTMQTYHEASWELRNVSNARYMVYPSGPCCDRAQNQQEIHSANFRVPTKIPPFHFGCKARLIIHED